MKALKNKLEKQKIQPSAGSWDKLSASLDAYQVPKRKPKFVFYYWGVAAAVLVLVGFLFMPNNDQSIHSNIKNAPKYVEQEIANPVLDSTKFQNLNTKTEPIIINTNITSNKDLVLKKSVEKQKNKKSDYKVETTSLVLNEKPEINNQVKNLVLNTKDDSANYIASLNESAKIKSNSEVKVDYLQLLNLAETELDETHKYKTLEKLKNNLKHFKTVIANRNLEQ